MTALLRAEGYPVNRKRVQRLMRQMGVAHIPTATTTAKGSRSVMILGGRSGGAST